MIVASAVSARVTSLGRASAAASGPRTRRRRRPRWLRPPPTAACRKGAWRPTRRSTRPTTTARDWRRVAAAAAVAVAAGLRRPGRGRQTRTTMMARTAAAAGVGVEQRMTRKKAVGRWWPVREWKEGELLNRTKREAVVAAAAVAAGV